MREISYRSYAQRAGARKFVRAKIYTNKVDSKKTVTLIRKVQIDIELIQGIFPHQKFLHINIFDQMWFQYLWLAASK